MKEFEGQFECLRENTEKYITFSIPTKKEHDNGKSIKYKIKFVLYTSMQISQSFIESPIFNSVILTNVAFDAFTNSLSSSIFGSKLFMFK